MSGGSADPAAVFRQEAQELLAQLEATLLELERRPDDPELAHTAFRALHTLKGSGAMFGPAPLARFAHAVETAFEGVRTGGRRPDGAFVGLMLRAADRLRQLADRPEDDDPAATGRLVAELAADGPGAGASPEAPAAPGAAAGAGQRAYRIRVKLAENALVFGANPQALLDELRTLGPCEVRADLSALPELERLDPSVLHMAWDVSLRTAEPRRAIDDVFLFVVDDGDIRIVEEDAAAAAEAASAAEDGREDPGATVVPIRPAAGPAAPVAAAAASGGGEPRRAAEAAGSVRVPAARLDLLMDQVGELVIAQARLSALAYGRRDPALGSAAEEIERLAAELRDSAMAMRMLPIGTLFGRFRRVVRDLSEELGKSVELATSGEETELDKRVVERLGDPLIHMIRNAIDHGIEAAETRRAAGKPATGTLRLEARQAGAEVMIALRDDGAGIDRERVLAKAQAQGLVPPGAARPTDAEIDQLIFSPGFSTAAAVTSVSGRGVGMDVVRRTIDELRGSIEIATTAGEGTSVTLRLPLTLAIIDGLLVRIGKGMYVIPLAAVEECVDLAATEHRGSGGRSFLNIRETLVPFLRLRHVFRVAADGRDEMVVVVGSDQGRVGLVVDQVVGHHQTVIKSLSRLHRDIAGLSGATILGDGRVALIVDVAPLIQFAQGTANQQQRLSA